MPNNGELPEILDGEPNTRAMVENMVNGTFGSKLDPKGRKNKFSTAERRAMRVREKHASDRLVNETLFGGKGSGDDYTEPETR